MTFIEKSTAEKKNTEMVASCAVALNRILLIFSSPENRDLVSVSHERKNESRMKPQLKYIVTKVERVAVTDPLDLPDDFSSL